MVTIGTVVVLIAATILGYYFHRKERKNDMEFIATEIVRVGSFVKTHKHHEVLHPMLSQTDIFAMIKDRSVFSFDSDQRRRFQEMLKEAADYIHICEGEIAYARFYQCATRLDLPVPDWRSNSR
jgi:hypothetical protein